jgi:hypothetical protein
MVKDATPGLPELATAVARTRIAGLVDVFLERRAEVFWRLAGGHVLAREALLREGTAVRRNHQLVSGDGLDRPVLAQLLGVTTRELPAFSAPAFPEPPRLQDALPELPAGWSSVRWRWSWAAVLAEGNAVALHRPEVAEITFADGHRALTVWPPPAPREEPPVEHPPTQARPGNARVLLAPAATAVLMHELVGHPLEGDLLLRGASPWRGRQGERIVGLQLSVSDDPTRTDLPGGFSADDEGWAGKPRQLLAEGTLVGALADTECAAALGVEPGNARRAGVHTRPRPRVSNLVATVADPLPHPPRNEASIEVVTLSSGTLEPASGAILLQVRTAFALRRGERLRPLSPFTLVGSLPALRSGMLAAAQPTLPVAEPGWCAKEGEVVPTGAVAPWLLLSSLEVR